MIHYLVHHQKHMLHCRFNHLELILDYWFNHFFVTLFNDSCHHQKLMLLCGFYYQVIPDNETDDVKLVPDDETM